MKVAQRQLAKCAAMQPNAQKLPTHISLVDIDLKYLLQAKICYAMLPPLYHRNDMKRTDIYPSSSRSTVLTKVSHSLSHKISDPNNVFINIDHILLSPSQLPLMMKSGWHGLDSSSGSTHHERYTQTTKSTMHLNCACICAPTQAFNLTIARAARCDATRASITKLQCAHHTTRHATGTLVRTRVPPRTLAAVQPHISTRA
jgi:hypothetical protein